jgi:hypothetical protein
MANQYFPTLVAAVAGTGSSANLVASSAGQSIRIWQLLISGTAADATVVITFTAAGTATTIKAALPNAGVTVLPMTGVPWAIADVATAVTFTAASTTTVTAYYTKGIGG